MSEQDATEATQVTVPEESGEPADTPAPESVAPAPTSEATAAADEHHGHGVLW